MGYTYVMADIHGMYNSYETMLRKIHFRGEDTLYILGDVVDRGKDGIRIIQDLMWRDNVTLLLGNHEDMMLHVVTLEDMSGEEYLKGMYQWARNGGSVTAHTFFECLNYKEQAKIIAYLEECPLFLPNIEVSGRKYYLVHACPDFEELADGIDASVITRDSLFVLPDREAELLKTRVLWKRLKGTEQTPMDCTVVFGHTPTYYYQDTVPMTCWRSHNIIDIDCGCSIPEKGGRLCCLRLDDEKEFYCKESED